MAAAVTTANAPSGSRNRMMILAALVFAAIAALLLFVALQSRGEGVSSVTAPASVDIVVAAQNIDANTKVTSEMLELKSIPTDQALTGAYSSIETAVGLPVRYPLQRGEQLTTTKVGLEAIEDEKDIALILEPGMRGFAVHATEVTAVGGLLLPGNFVDVIAAFGENTGGIEKAVTILQNVEVLSVAQEAVEPIPVMSAVTGVGEEEAAAGGGLRGQRSDEVERQPGARSVTLAVTPEQAQLLANLQAQDDVEIWLALRPVDDSAIPELNETNLLEFHSPVLLQP